MKPIRRLFYCTCLLGFAALGLMTVREAGATDTPAPARPRAAAETEPPAVIHLPATGTFGVPTDVPCPRGVAEALAGGAVEGRAPRRFIPNMMGGSLFSPLNPSWIEGQNFGGPRYPK